MFDVIGGGLLGAISGGVFRLAPEVLKWLDKKDERKHELLMFERQCELEKLKGDIKLGEIAAQRQGAIDTGVLDAFKSVIDQQTELAKTAKGWTAALSASVRPVVTYWILFIWSFVHVWYAWNGWSAGMNATEVFKTMLSPDFAALVGGIINYYFLNRTLEKRGL